MSVFSSARRLLASSLALSLLTTSFGATAMVGCATTDDEPTGVDVAASTAASLPVTVTAAGATQQADLKRSDIDSIEAALPPFRADGVLTTDSKRVLTANQITAIGPDGQLLRWTRSGNTLTSLDDSTRSLRWSLATGELEIVGAGGTSRMKVMGDPTDITRVISAFVRIGTGDSSTSVAAALTGGEVVVVVVVIAFSSWMACLTLGTAVCGMTAYLNCPSGVDWFKMNCGVNIGSIGSEEGMIGDMGSLGSCNYKCNEPPPPDPDPPHFPPGTWVPGPPTYEWIPTLGDCPEGQHMDFCITGWHDEVTFDGNEVTVTAVPESEPCCVADGTP